MVFHLNTLLFGLLVAGQTVSASSLSEKYAGQIREAVEMGGRIYEKDQIAARATDALFEAVDVGEGPAVDGWITIRREAGWLVRFVTTVSGEYRAAYDVLLGVEGAEVVEVADPPLPLEKDEEAMFRARQAAMAAIPFRCTERFNTVVLPAGDGWIVYVLGASDVPGEIVVGGHFRAEVSADGSEVLEMRKLSNACLTLDLPDEAEGKERDKPPFAYVTHILSETPIETHVFLSRTYGIPIFVVTGTGIWLVADGEIAYDSPLPEEDEKD